MGSEAQKSSKHELLIERLAGTFERLYQGNTVDKAWLCNTYGITSRTAYRDLARIGHLVDEVSPGKFRLTRTRQPALSYTQLSEFAQLTDVAKLFPDADGKELREALSHRDTLLIKGNSSRNNRTVAATLHDLTRAISQHRRITFVYKNKPRDAEPYKLINQSGIWYLAAAEAGRLKSFDLAKIQQLQVQDVTFQVQQLFLDIIHEENGIWFGKRTEVRLRASARAASYLQRRPLFPHQQIITSHADGGITLTTAITEPQLLFRWLRYWLPEIRILTPIEWHDNFQRELQAYLEKLTEV